MVSWSSEKAPVPDAHFGFQRPQRPRESVQRRGTEGCDAIHERRDEVLLVGKKTIPLAQLLIQRGPHGYRQAPDQARGELPGWAHLAAFCQAVASSRLPITPTIRAVAFPEDRGPGFQTNGRWWDRYRCAGRGAPPRWGDARLLPGTSSRSGCSNRRWTCG